MAKVVLHCRLCRLLFKATVSALRAWYVLPTVFFYEFYVCVILANKMMMFLPPLCARKPLGIRGTVFLWARFLSCDPDKQCQSTGGLLSTLRFHVPLGTNVRDVRISQSLG